MSHLKPSKTGDIYRMNRIFLFLLLFSIVLVSCEKNGNEPFYDYLVSAQKVKSIAKLSAKLKFSFLSATYPEIQSINDNCLNDVDIYRVTYKTSFKGNVIIASGLICVPSVAGVFPMVTFQNGTNTKHAYAPSVDLTNEQFDLLESMSTNGYVMLIPDYLGFGASESMLHPYHHRASSDAAIIDLIRAADEFLSSGKTKASADGRLFLMGYSQGGWATLSALNNLETTTILDKEIVAASCGAGGYKLYDISKHILVLDTFPAPLYLPYFIESRRRNGFLTYLLSLYFKEPYASRIPGLFDGSLGNDEINLQLNDTISSLLTDNLIANFELDDAFASLRTELTTNSITAWNLATPLLLAAGTADMNVPPFVAQQMYDEFTSAGVSPDKIRLVRYEGLTHETALLPWGIETINWFNELK